MPAHQSACSFCGKSRTQVQDLIASRRSSPAHICDECVGICSRILAENEGEGKGTGAFGPPFRDPDWLRQGLHCSFCRRHQDLVRKLICSPAGTTPQFICDRCVQIAVRLLRKAKDQELRQGWGLAGWLRRRLTPPAGRLHHMR
jgi:ATP-dependent protease Clp ATPase subunit